MRKTVVLLLTLFGTAILTTASDASEQVYQWVDEKGVVHFDQNPPTRQKSETLKIGTGKTTAAPDESAEMTAERKKAAADAELCAVATKNHAGLSTDQEAQRADQYGNIKALSKEEKAKERDLAAAAMKRYCIPKVGTP